MSGVVCCSLLCFRAHQSRCHSCCPFYSQICMFPSPERHRRGNRPKKPKLGCHLSTYRRQVAVVSDQGVDPKSSSLSVPSLPFPQTMPLPAASPWHRLPTQRSWTHPRPRWEAAGTAWLRMQAARGWCHVLRGVSHCQGLSLCRRTMASYVQHHAVCDFAFVLMRLHHGDHRGSRC